LRDGYEKYIKKTKPQSGVVDSGVKKSAQVKDIEEKTALIEQFAKQSPLDLELVVATPESGGKARLYALKFSDYAFTPENIYPLESFDFKGSSASVDKERYHRNIVSDLRKAYKRKLTYAEINEEIKSEEKGQAKPDYDSAISALQSAMKYASNKEQYQSAVNALQTAKKYAA
jgi:hypothetical protein